MLKILPANLKQMRSPLTVPFPLRAKLIGPDYNRGGLNAVLLSVTVWVTVASGLVRSQFHEQVLKKQTDKHNNRSRHENEPRTLQAGRGFGGGIREEAIRPFYRPMRVGVVVWVGTLQPLNMCEFGKENDATDIRRVMK